MQMRVVCLLTSLRAFRAGPQPALFRSAPLLCHRAIEAREVSRRAAAGAPPAKTQQASGRARLTPLTSAEPRFPLCEREPAYSADLGSLLAWRQRALAQVEAVGDSWAQADQGPSADDLRTELNWLLDDALVGLAWSSEQLQPRTWREVQQDLRFTAIAPDSLDDYRVQLREPLARLEELWAARLEQRVPLQYLTASAFWRELVLSVGPGVLIPRPETELMIDFVQEAVAASPQLAEGQWVDLGTGSGALAIGLAQALPVAAAVWAVDVDEAPLAYAAFNARRLGLVGRVHTLRGCWYEPLAGVGVGPGQLAGILSNPPYIGTEDLPGLQAEVGRHEPMLALDGGGGLAVDSLVPICAGAVRLLQRGGLLALETGGGEQAMYIADVLRHLRGSAGTGTASWQDGNGWASGAPSLDAVGAWSSDGEEAAALDEQPAFTDVQVRKDLFGVARFVTATRA